MDAHWHEQGSHIFLETSFAAAALSVLTLPLLLGFVATRRRCLRRRRGICVECGYDLTGNVSGICPECGAR